MISQRIRSAAYLKGKKDSKYCDDEQTSDHCIWSDDEDTLLEVASEHNDEQEELDYFEQGPAVREFTPKQSSNASFNKSTRAFFS
jgi:hypothetical protein